MKTLTHFSTRRGLSCGSWNCWWKYFRGANLARQCIYVYSKSACTLCFFVHHHGGNGTWRMTRWDPFHVLFAVFFLTTKGFCFINFLETEMNKNVSVSLFPARMEKFSSENQYLRKSSIFPRKHTGTIHIFNKYTRTIKLSQHWIRQRSKCDSFCFILCSLVD